MAPELEIRRILLVDDEPYILQALARILNKENIQTKSAENAAQALELLSAQTFHTVICDIMMPEMSGLECLATAQINGIVTPFIFLTGYGDQQRMLEAIRLGAVDFINKPFENSEIIDVAYRVLDIGTRRQRMLKQIEHENLNLFEQIKRNERMIALMRANNNKKAI